MKGVTYSKRRACSAELKEDMLPLQWFKKGLALARGTWVLKGRNGGKYLYLGGGEGKKTMPGFEQPGFDALSILVSE